MDPTLVAAGIGGVPAIVAAWFAYRSSVRANQSTDEANRIARTKVDAEAYERSQAFYEKLLGEADKHLDRLRAQVDLLSDQLNRVNQQLVSEQEVSATLRGQVRVLGAQVATMEGTIAEVRRQVEAARANPPTPPTG